jgi:cell fate (sporulation/competence/biofilm development) regulator YlbF (YheA/YmcA/DUF963 family)
MDEKSKIKDDLIKLANLFGQAILDSSEYKNLIKCNENLVKDQEAQDLLREYRLKQLELRKGFDRKVLGELNDLETQLKNNETLANLENSQEAIAALFKSSNELISEKIGQSFAHTGVGCR